MKICLVMPPPWSVDQPPLSFAYLASTIKDWGHEARVLDLNLKLYKSLPDLQGLWDPYYSFIWELKESFPVLLAHFWPILRQAAKKAVILGGGGSKSGKDQICAVGFSVTRTSITTALVMARMIKRMSPDCVIIFGGPEAGRIYRLKGLGSRKVVDFIIRDEGEVTLPELLDELAELKENKLPEDENFPDVMGLCKPMPTGNIKWWDERNPIKHLDGLLPPTFSVFKRAEYLYPDILPIQSSRGYPFKEIISGSHSKLFRNRSTESLLTEIKRNLKKYKVNQFNMVDNIINGDLYELDRFCQRIVDNELKFTWWGRVKPDPEMSGELLEKMKNAGCYSLDFYIESGSQEFLDSLGNETKISVVSQNLADAREAGIITGLDLAIGFPGETRGHLQESFNFINDNKHALDYVTSTFMPESLLDDELIMDPFSHIPTLSVDEEFQQLTVHEWLYRMERLSRIIDSHNIENRIFIPPQFQRSWLRTRHFVNAEDMDKAQLYFMKASVEATALDSSRDKTMADLISGALFKITEGNYYSISKDPEHMGIDPDDFTNRAKSTLRSLIDRSGAEAEKVSKMSSWLNKVYPMKIT